MTFPYQQPQPQGYPQQQQFPGAQPPQQFPGVPQGQALPQFPQQQAAPTSAPQSVEDFLAGGGGKTINFGNAQLGFKRLGKPFGGKVISAKTSVVTNYTTKQPERWSNGDPKTQLVIQLDTLAGPYPEREDANDDGKRTLYVKGSMVNPFRDAVLKGNNGSPAIQPGAFVQGCHTGTNGQAYTWAFEYDPQGFTGQSRAIADQAAAAQTQQPPAPQQYAAPAQQPAGAGVPQDQAAAFAAWQAQQAAAQPQPTQAANPFLNP